jgi:hypothetical protein
MKRLRAVTYGWKTRRGSLCLAISLVVLFLGVYFIGYQDTLTTAWQNIFDPAISIITLAVALAIWWSELKEEHRNSLPKRMTVRFLYRNQSEDQKVQEVMVCEHAPIASEDDIRALAQQIGLQMAEGERLDFVPMFDIEYPNEEEKDYVSYEVHIQLLKIPEALQEVYNSGATRVWRAPFAVKPWRNKDIAQTGTTS